MKKDGMG